jgi:2-C-methyl-D-erythritol 4-phosphate cytidylyltransferase
MSGEFAVIIPAAGKSTRFAGREKKPFASLDGRPIWLRTAELFWSRAEVSRVYIVVAPADREDFRGRFGHLLAFANAEIVNGGEERFDSVANALERVPADVPFVAVHDAVRPLTPPSLIDATFAAARKHGAALPAVAVSDTLKRVDDATSTITGTVPRAGLWQAQTPQVFRREWIIEAYARRRDAKTPITDDAEAMEAVGHAVVVVTGSPLNFKITTKDDLELAQATMKARDSKKPDPRPTGGAFDDEAKW